MKTTGITTDNLVLAGNELIATNFPNPFKNRTTFNYDLPESGKVELVVYDLTGHIVTSIVNDVQDAGSQTVEFIRPNIQDGIYIYRLTLEGEKDRVKEGLVKDTMSSRHT